MLKILLLVVLRKHICEIHWRVASSTTTWFNYFAFGLFICLGVAFIRARGWRRALAVFALLAGAAQVVGVIGYVSDFMPANFGADVCDLLMPIILILLGIAFRQEAKKERGELTTETQRHGEE